MKGLSVKTTSNGLLLCVLFSLIWGVIGSSTTSASVIVPTTSATKPQPRTPENVETVTVVTQNERSITLEWNKVDNILDYTLKYNNNDIDKEENITATSEVGSVQHVVSDLNAGTKYSFTLFTVLEDVRSIGHNFTAVTAPKKVENVTVVIQTESSITLEWNKVNNIFNYTLQYNNDGTDEEENITATSEVGSVQHVVFDLNAGTKYSFTLFTVFEDVRSIERNFTAATAPKKVENVTVVTQTERSITLEWNKVDNIFNYTLQYKNNDNDEEENITATSEVGSVQHVVSDLTAGTKYSFTLFTVFEDVRSIGHNFTAPTAPKKVENVTVVTQTERSITLEWNKVDNILDYTLQYNNNDNDEEENITATSEVGPVQHVVSDLNAGTKYSFTLFTVFEDVRSIEHNFTAATAPKKVETVTVVTQNERSITLEWNKVNNILDYTLKYNNNDIDKEENITATSEVGSVQHVVSDLNAGTKYSFTLFTVFEDVRSIGHNFTAVTAPKKVENVTVVTQNESSITLEWDKVDDILDYTLKYSNDGSDEEENITATSEVGPVERVVSNLTAGTKYSFTLFTVFENVRSIERNFTAATVPLTVSGVTVTERFATSITLEWKNANKAWRYLLQIEDRTVILEESSDIVSYTVKRLQPGKKYKFTVTTEFSELRSSAYEVVVITAIDCGSVNWRVTSTSIQGIVEGLFSNATAASETGTHESHGGKNVSFTDLYPGENYEIYLHYEDLVQCNHGIQLPPSSVSSGRCEYAAAGYSVRVVWDKPYGKWTDMEVKVTGREESVKESKELFVEISGFQPAKTYEVSLSLISGSLRSEKALVFPCSTDPRGVIAGSVMGVLLFVILVCVGVFIFRKRPDIISRKKLSKKSNSKSKAISVAKFPDHFVQLSLDENRGFSQEYEALSPVGTDQTRKAATLPDNKVKNRFNNVLPYDWNRVKLTTSNHNESSDYINASYMPGYSSNREYIASQGPLPSTANDFWRMIWEQRVRGIVMVTNCTEGGRTKCEQYWSTDSQPRLYGELSVTTRSEQQEPNWTLREFSVKHKNTSEERTVKHFHFTAWPDHGVPQGTEILIQFRELMRHHIVKEGAKAPTVVHCSAGVGRTGTIIALDVLLQQLEKEQAVGINAFVHKMRLNRPHMVQTESQYIFLHRCIMDSLQPKEKIEENIYENQDIIYANATALQELRQHNRNA